MRLIPACVVVAILLLLAPPRSSAEPSEAGVSPGGFPTVPGANGQLWTGTAIGGGGAMAGGLPAEITAVFEWNNGLQRFDFWFRGFPDGFQTLLGITPGSYYFFQSSVASMVPVPGEGSFTLPPAGGSFDTAATGATGYLWSGCDLPMPGVSSLPDAVTAVFNWSNENQRFDFWFRGFPDGFQTLSDGLTYGDYYFFQSTAANVPIPTPACACVAADGFNFASAISGPPPSLTVFVQHASPLTGAVVINGVDTAQPQVPFTFEWGDGVSTSTFFPASHTFADTGRNYVVRVTAHYPGGATGEAAVLIWFRIPKIQYVPLDPLLAVSIPQTVPVFGTRLYPVPTGLIAVPEAAFWDFTRSDSEYLLSIAAQVQHGYANHDVEQVGPGFQQVVVGDPGFPQGMYSIWYSTPVAFAVGQSGPQLEFQLSSFFHEMGHNVTLNSPAAFRYGGRIDGNANAIFSETMAQIFQHATVYDLVRDGAVFGLGCDTRELMRASGLASFRILRLSYDIYVNSGAQFSSWNDPASPQDETFGTFMTLAFKFFEHAEATGLGVEAPLQRMNALLQTFDAQLQQSYDPAHNTPEAATFRSTLMVAALSAAFAQDLRAEFRQIGFPIDDAAFMSLLSRVN